MCLFNKIKHAFLTYGNVKYMFIIIVIVIAIFVIIPQVMREASHAAPIRRARPPIRRARQHHRQQRPPPTGSCGQAPRRPK